jgi:hypothetical protein
MDVDSTVAVAPAEPSQGLAPSTGQAAPASGTPTSGANSQAAPATPSEQTPGQGGTPKALWNDLTSAERDYKALQAEYTKTKQQMAKFGDLTVAEQRIQLLGQLQQDPKFREWAQSRLTEAETGRSDPETVEALKIVQQVAQRQVQEALAPLAAQMQAARLQAVTSAMDRKHPEWKDHKEKVRDTLIEGIQRGIFPQSVVHNMSLEFLEKLYAMTVGLDEDHQAKVYGKRLAQKHAASTQSTPGTAPAATAHAPVKSIHDALALARKQLG